MWKRQVGIVGQLPSGREFILSVKILKEIPGSYKSNSQEEGTYRQTLTVWKTNVSRDEQGKSEGEEPFRVL